MATTMKTAAIAFTAMAGLGAALPLAAYFANDHHVPPLTEATSMPLPAPELAAPAPAPASEEVAIEAAILVGRRPAPPAAAKEPVAEPERRCTWHHSEALASGRVMVCDQARTSNEREHGTFKIDTKVIQLAPRDTPSPSGLIR